MSMARILVVEDQFSTALVLEYQLAGLGEVRVAANATQAKAETAWLADPDEAAVAIVDLGLPSRGTIDHDAGFRVIEAIERSGVHVPVIAMTIRNDRDAWEKARSRGTVVWFFFTKPWDSSQLAVAVKAALSRARPKKTPVIYGHVEGADEN
jgi:CheY-like chemotaxis protein